MHKLDRDRGGDPALRRRARGAGGQQGQRGTQRLAAADANGVTVGVGEAVVVGGDAADARAQPVDRGFCRWANQVTRHGDACGHHDRHERTSLSFRVSHFAHSILDNS